VLEVLIAAFFGALLGAAINSIAYAYKVRQHKKQKLNKALFSLLKIWNQLVMAKIFMSIDVMGIIHKELVSRNIESSDLEEKEKTSLIKEVFYTFSPSSSDDNFQTYQVALTDISLFDPLLALQIDAVHNLSQVINSLDAYHFENVSGQVPFELSENLLLIFSGMIFLLSEKVLTNGQQKEVEEMLSPWLVEGYQREAMEKLSQEVRLKISVLLDEMIADG